MGAWSGDWWRKLKGRETVYHKVEVMFDHL